MWKLVNPPPSAYIYLSISVFMFPGGTTTVCGTFDFSSKKIVNVYGISGRIFENFIPLFWWTFQK